MMMIAFITFKSSLVPLFEGLWSSNSWEFELSGFSRNRTDDRGIDSPSLWPTEPRLHVSSQVMKLIICHPRKDSRSFFHIKFICMYFFIGTRLIFVAPGPLQVIHIAATHYSWGLSAFRECVVECWRESLWQTTNNENIPNRYELFLAMSREQRGKLTDICLVAIIRDISAAKKLWM